MKLLYDNHTAELPVGAYHSRPFEMDDFEHVIKDYEAIIFHLIHKYQIRDIEGEFYQEGLIALGQTYQQHDRLMNGLYQIRMENLLVLR